MYSGPGWLIPSLCPQKSHGLEHHDRREAGYRCHKDIPGCSAVPSAPSSNASLYCCVPGLHPGSCHQLSLDGRQAASSSAKASCLSRLASPQLPFQNAVFKIDSIISTTCPGFARAKGLQAQINIPQSQLPYHCSVAVLLLT